MGAFLPERLPGNRLVSGSQKRCRKVRNWVKNWRLAPVKRRDRALRLEATHLATEPRYRVSAWR